MTVRGRWRRLVSLGRLLAGASGEDRRILLRALRQVAAVWLRMRFPRALRGYAAAALEWEEGARSAPSPVDPARAARLADLFGSVQAALPFGVACLPRSVALSRFLRDYGVEARLRLGMRAAADGLRGHAWIDCQGLTPGEPGDPAAAFRLLEQATYNPPAEGG